MRNVQYLGQGHPSWLRTGGNEGHEASTTSAFGFQMLRDSPPSKSWIYFHELLSPYDLVGSVFPRQITPASFPQTGVLWGGQRLGDWLLNIGYTSEANRSRTKKEILTDENFCSHWIPKKNQDEEHNLIKKSGYGINPYNKSGDHNLYSESSGENNSSPLARLLHIF
jgi:hypothetical protein